MTLTGILDIALVAALIYAVLAWFKKTKAVYVAIGMVMVALVYAFARAMGMAITVWLLHGFFAITIFAVVVIFQEELRHLFERVAMWTFHRGGPDRPAATIADILIATATTLAEHKTGALIVVQGKDPLRRHVDGGWALDGQLSQALLESIFDAHSPGHDGAVIIENGRLARFGCHLPLSKELVNRPMLGTRHSAALGVSERADALGLIVSEERGTISVTRHGELEVVTDVHALHAQVERHLAELAPRSIEQTARLFFTHNLREKWLALGVSTLIWLVFTGIG